MDVTNRESFYVEDLNRIKNLFKSNPEDANHLIRYMVRYHFEVKEYDKVFQLLISNQAWADANYEFLQTYSNYLDDLDLTKTLFVGPITPDQLVIFTALCTANLTILTLVESYTDDDLMQLTALGKSTKAIEMAKLRRDPKHRYLGYTSILKTLARVNKYDYDLIKLIADTATEIGDAEERSKSLHEFASFVAPQNTELALSLSQAAFEHAKLISDPTRRTSILIMIASESPIGLNSVFGEISQAILDIKKSNSSYPSSSERYVDEVKAHADFALRLHATNDNRAFQLLDEAYTIVQQIPKDNLFTTQKEKAFKELITALIITDAPNTIQVLENLFDIWSKNQTLINDIANLFLDYKRYEEYLTVVRYVTSIYGMRGFIKKLTTAKRWDEATFTADVLTNLSERATVYYHLACELYSIEDSRAFLFFGKSADLMLMHHKQGEGIQVFETKQCVKNLAIYCVYKKSFDDAIILAQLVDDAEARVSLLSNVIAVALAMDGQIEKAQTLANKYELWIREEFNRQWKELISDYRVKASNLPNLHPMKPIAFSLLRLLMNLDYRHVDLLMNAVTTVSEAPPSKTLTILYRFLSRKSTKHTQNPNDQADPIRIALPGLMPSYKLDFTAAFGSAVWGSTKNETSTSRPTRSLILDQTFNSVKWIVDQHHEEWLGLALNGLLYAANERYGNTSVQLAEILGWMISSTDQQIQVFVKSLTSDTSNIALQINIISCLLLLKSSKIEEEITRVQHLISNNTTQWNHEDLIQALELFGYSKVSSLNNFARSRIIEYSSVRQEPQTHISSSTPLTSQTNRLIHFEAQALDVNPEVKATLDNEDYMKLGIFLADIEDIRALRIFDLVKTNLNSNFSIDFACQLTEQMYRVGQLEFEEIINNCLEKARSTNIYSKSQWKTQTRGQFLGRIAITMFRVLDARAPDVLNEAIAAARAIPSIDEADNDEDKRTKLYSRFFCLRDIARVANEMRDTRAIPLTIDLLNASSQAGGLGMLEALRDLMKTGYTFTESDIQVLMQLAINDASYWSGVINILFDAQLYAYVAELALSLKFPAQGEAEKNVLNYVMRLHEIEQLPTQLIDVGRYDLAVKVHTHMSLLNDPFPHYGLSEAIRQTFKRLFIDKTYKNRFLLWLSRVFWLLMIWFVLYIIVLVYYTLQFRSRSKDFHQYEIDKTFARCKRNLRFYFYANDEIEINKSLAELSKAISQMLKRRSNSPAQNERWNKALVEIFTTCNNDERHFLELENQVPAVLNMAIYHHFRDQIKLEQSDKNNSIDELMKRVNLLSKDQQKAELKNLSVRFFEEHYYTLWFQSLDITTVDELLWALKSTNGDIEKRYPNLTHKLIDEIIRIASWVRSDWKDIYELLLSPDF